MNRNVLLTILIVILSATLVNAKQPHKNPLESGLFQKGAKGKTKDPVVNSVSGISPIQVTGTDDVTVSILAGGIGSALLADGAITNEKLENSGITFVGAGGIVVSQPSVVAVDVDFDNADNNDNADNADNNDNADNADNNDNNDNADNNEEDAVQASTCSSTVNLGQTVTISLGDDSVTSAKIVDGTIDTADIGDGKVSNAKLANSAITINDQSVSLGASITLPFAFAYMMCTVGNNIDLGRNNRGFPTCTSRSANTADATFDVGTGSTKGLTLNEGTWHINYRFSGDRVDFIYDASNDSPTTVDSLDSVPTVRGGVYVAVIPSGETGTLYFVSTGSAIFAGDVTGFRVVATKLFLAPN